MPRKNESITGKAFNKIQSYNVGDTFTVSDIYNSGDLSCGSMYGPRQRLYDVLCFLNKTGLISRVKRGTYRLDYPFPPTLTSSDIYMYCGYKKTGSYDENNRYIGEVDRKENPFDIDEYKASFISNPPTEVRNDEFPKADVYTESTNPVTKTIYSVNPKTGEINPSQILAFDVSYLATPFVFDDIDSAEAFAEGLVIIEVDNDDGLDNALSEIESEIAEVLFEEGNPKSDPEYKSSVTEEQFEEAKETLIAQNETKSLGEFVAVKLPVGTVVYIVTSDGSKLISIGTDEVVEININIGTNGVSYEFECLSGNEFNYIDLGVKVFTEKAEAITAVTELV